MEQLKKQVQRARGRLNLQQFLGIVTWSLFAWLLVGVLALAVPKIWALGWEPQTFAIYKWSVVGAAVALGLVTAGLWTWLRRRDDLAAAIELDRRFGLKERVSSSLSLAPADLETEAGQALVSDAVRRVERLDVKERFRVAAGWKALLPLLPAAAVFVLAVVVSDAVDPESAEAEARTVEVKRQIKTSTDLLKKKMAQRKKEAAERGLTDAEQMFDKLEKGLDGIHEKAPADRKKAMAKINTLAKDLKERANKLKDAQEMRKQLNQLNDLKQGPADKMAKAMQNGDFKKAIEEMGKLQEQLANGELNQEQRQQLQEQMEQMQQKLQDVADAQQQAMQQLQQKIEQAQANGDNQAAGEMQEQLEQMQQQQQQMQQMANQLGNAANQMQQGNQQAAAQQLQDLAQNLQNMQNAEDELEMVEQALDQIAQAKDGMKCGQCQGGGCEACQGQGNQLAQGGQGGGQKREGPPGRGMGAGAGQGERPEEEHDTGSFDSQVRSNKLGRGEAYVVGSAGGPNRAGQAREEIKESVDAVLEGASKPLSNKRLPRPQREHAKQYFDSIREGE